MGSRQPVCFTVTLVRENRCRGFYRQGVGRLLESVIMYAVEVAAEHAVAADIVRERGERTEMIARVRSRALTMPPTDELRQLIEKSDKITIDHLTMENGDAPVRKPGSVGRRAGDRGDNGNDRQPCM